MFVKLQYVFTKTAENYIINIAYIRREAYLLNRNLCFPRGIMLLPRGKSIIHLAIPT